VRLWSLHPCYLDARGLVALWREALLAQAVLRRRTKGYRHHPQLDRFRDAPAPVGAIAAYLRAVRAEGSRRGYAFDPRRIARAGPTTRATVTRGQLDWERRHLLSKLRRRDPSRAVTFAAVRRPRAHPLFRVVPGGVEDWERVG
jgi:pyrimidine dimer DNA glycosylase